MAFMSILAMTSDELSRLAASGSRGWLSTDHITWVLDKLNKSQNDVLLFCPNAVVDVQSTMARMSKSFNLGTLKRMVFVLNVGNRQGATTFIGGLGNNPPGNHWVLVVIELRPYKRIYYCDSLAWEFPAELLAAVNRFVTYIPQVGEFEQRHVSMAHCPQATTTNGHRCDGRCLNYSLQTCSSMCGVIALANAATAALNDDLLKWLTGPPSKNSLYLQHPSQHVYYLRRVLMAWFAEGKIELDYMLPPVGSMTSNQQSSDHNFSQWQKVSGRKGKTQPVDFSASPPRSDDAVDSSPSKTPSSNDSPSFVPPEAKMKDSLVNPPSSAPPKEQTKITSANLSPAKSKKRASSDNSSPLKAKKSSASKSCPKYQCNKCGQTLSSRNTLYKHRLRHRRRNNTKQHDNGKGKPVICPDCRDTENMPNGFDTTKQLIAHLNSDHDRKLVIEESTFNCWQDFQKWKQEEETITKTWYVRPRADRHTEYYNTTWLHCNRAGTFETRGSGKRPLKSQGTSKTGCSCPAFITAWTYVTGEVKAEYCLKHVGHRQESAYNRISPEMRTTIAAKLAQGVSMNSVLDYIRDNIVGPLHRDHLTTRADLRNIKQQYSINSMQKANNDADSVLFWVEEMTTEDYNPVICFKRQGEKSIYPGVENKDFLLGLQTEFQAKMFKQHAHKVVCLDGTHGTTAYDFQLITVMVIDDFNEGIPAAWLITNRETADALKVFFTSIRERCGNVQTDDFMSDDAEQYYNAWRYSFSRPNRKLLCSWHVDRSWRRKLNQCIKDREQQAEMYAVMKALQNEPSEAQFRRSLQQFLAWVKDISEPLANYFQKEYVGRVGEWAACFRAGSKTNTNMFVESFHRTLKHVYFERKQNRRVDHLIFKLGKISRDKAFEQLIKAEKGKSTIRQRESCKRHKQAEATVQRKGVLLLDSNSWTVESVSKKGTQYHVRRLRTAPCTCLLQCKFCNACVHKFKCTCPDYILRSLVCIHIHSVNIFYHSHITTQLEQDKVDHIEVEDFVHEREELSKIIHQEEQLKEEQQLQDLKTVALGKISELSDLIRQAPTRDTISSTLQHTRSAISVAKVLSVIGNDHHYLQTKSIPSNKLAEKQNNFLSTRKKKSVRHQMATMSDTTQTQLEEAGVEVCGFCLKENPPGMDNDTVDWIV
ncbi:PREDICTED: uncharacterized protein LOC106819642 [Priapulus caudatus]|uniref:Uncharacterized protein LOC106819642 n=1 Tax=Priapulus caudatus TaxID=37621 RepID=A0ABM1F5L2_PRICU|nr:PREDICTED: uncharacterized protein LOC106819642 [Priapulus caudatus]